MRHWGPAGAIAIGLGAWLACGTAARAQGLLPPTGVDTRVGDLRGYFDQAFGQVLPEAQTQEWIYSAALDVSETYDTAIPISSGTGNRNAHDFITRITPSVGITGDSSRLTGSLFYSPSVNIYTFHGNQNGIDQNLNGAATAVVVPDFFFVDLRAFAAEEQISGYAGPTGTTDVGSSNQALTTSFSIAPTLRHSFKTLLNTELGYSLTRTAYAANGDVAAATAAEVNQNVVTQEEHATISTGEDFGRFGDSLAAQASQSSGTGVLQGASNETITDTVTYALSRMLAATASIGHEDITYGGTNPLKINDVVWSGGLQWTPNPDTSADIGYGHQQGQSSFYLNATFAPTALTRVYARYSQGVGTTAQNLQTAVASSTVGSTGVVIDRATGMPVLLNNNFFVTQSGVFRTTSASISGVLLWPRDVFNVSLQHQETSQLENAAGGTPSSSTSSTGEFGTLSWTHNVSEDLQTSALAQYGMNSGSGVGITSQSSQTSILLNLGMTYAISDTLGLSAQYTFTTQPTGFANANGTGNGTTARSIAVVSIHKTF